MFSAKNIVLLTEINGFFDASLLHNYMDVIEVCPMMKRLYYSLIITIGYLIVSNLGNMVFGISKEFSWTTTLWESLFFFIFVFLLQNYRKK